MKNLFLKLIAMILVLVFALALVSCGIVGGNNNETKAEENEDEDEDDKKKDKKNKKDKKDDEDDDEDEDDEDDVDDKKKDDKKKDDDEDEDDKKKDDKKKDDDEDKEDEASIVGEWICTINMADMLNEMIAGSDDEDMAKYLKTDEFNFALVMEFTKKGKVTMSLDKDTFEDSLDDYSKVLRKGMKNYFEDMIEEEELDMTLDEFAEAMEYDDIDAFLDEMCGVFIETVNEQFNPDEASETGYYKLDGKKLYIVDDEDDLEDSDEYVKVTIDDDTLVLSKGNDDSFADLENAGFELPLTFTRVD